MKLATCWVNNSQIVSVVSDKQLVFASNLKGWPEELNGVIDVVEAGQQTLTKIERLVNNAVAEKNCIALSEANFLAPLPVPRKNIMCLGFNYAEHAKESLAAHHRDINYPEHPIVFTKSVTSVNAPYGDIPIDKSITAELDWEVELAVIIGKSGKNISAAHAMQHVFGYTVLNDLSARDIQFRHKQYYLGKSLDGACPMGPWIVTADEISDPHQLKLQCRVNGELKQQSDTSKMIFKIPEIIEVLSRGTTLQPGDVIATGTPSGVGFARTPPEFLSPGDTVECEIENIGLIRNRIVQA